MIYAKTKLKKIPATCKTCKFSIFDFSGVRMCAVCNKECPWENKGHGNVGYGKPSWCPLVELQRGEK